ncbi:MAG: hypothetical protein JOZ18_05955 [Chloroflexi bacterium]|nr:hypothetical protein [Chloroflexota bacterium]
MVKPRRQIFRESAMKQYLQRREQDILPYTVSPPAFACSWIVLVLFLTLGLLAWSADLPTVVVTEGIVTQIMGPQASSTGGNAQALVFFPTSDASQLHAGQAIQLQIGATGPHLNSRITQVEQGVISPTDARNRYGLDTGAAQVLTQPSVVVIVDLDKSISASTYAGTTVSAQVQVGFHSVLSQL